MDSLEHVTAGNPHFHLLQGSHELGASDECEYILPLHSSWLHRHLENLRRHTLPFSPLILVYPTFALASKLWLSEWRNMRVLQVLLQHSPMQLPKEIPRGAL